MAFLLTWHYLKTILFWLQRRNQLELIIAFNHSRDHHLTRWWIYAFLRWLCYGKMISNWKMIIMTLFCRKFKLVSKLWIMYFQWSNLNLQSLNFLLHVFEPSNLFFLCKFWKIYTAWWRNSLLFSLFIGGIDNFYVLIISILITEVNHFIAVMQSMFIFWERCRGTTNKECSILIPIFQIHRVIYLFNKIYCIDNIS
jgi:hypothetical protein